MKSTIVILITLLPLFAQSQDSTYQDRKVFSQTVAMWQNNYTYIQEVGVIGKNTNNNSKLLLPKDIILKYFNDQSNVTDTTINFWYYIKEDGIPQIAIELPNVNQTDPIFLACNEQHVWEETKKTVLQKDFDYWEQYSKDTTNILVYVKMYQFDKEYILNAINESGGSEITIENVVHTIMPNTDRYEHPSRHKGVNAINYEGFLVLDILIKTNTQQKPIHYNFARPCPKLCPND